MDIECEFSTDGSSWRSWYTCEVTEASILRPNAKIVSYKGIHEQGKNNNDVTWLIYRNVKVEYFPRNPQRTFPNLQYLTIENCGLKEISRRDLLGLEKLSYLNLGNNELTSLPDDLFSNMPKLREIWLDDNKIEYASSKLIEPIVGNQLQCFYLRMNTSIDEFYYPREETGCTTIQELMAKIDEKCKPPEPPMTSKAVKSNPICERTDETLKGLNELRSQGRFTDFVIVVGSKEFPVHKIVLAVQSSVLAELLEVKTNGRSAIKLEISDMSAEAVEAFLDYLYGRKQPDAENAVEIFKLSAKYEVVKLRSICEKIIGGSLDESNAFEIFKLACGPHKSEKLKVAAFRKLQEKFGNDLGDNLINKPEKIQKIVELKRQIDALTKEDQE